MGIHSSRQEALQHVFPRKSLPHFWHLLRWLRKHTPLSFWDTLGFDWRDLWLTPLISSKSLLCDWVLQPFAFSEIQANCIVTLSVFSLEHALLIVNLLIIMSFAIWLSWELLKSSIPCSSLLNCLLSIHLFPLYYKKQEETGHTFNKLFGNLLSQISIFYPLQVLLFT